MSPVKTLSLLVAPAAGISALVVLLAFCSAGGQAEPVDAPALDVRDLVNGMRALTREIEELRAALPRAADPAREALPATSRASQPSTSVEEPGSRDLEGVIEQIAARAGATMSAAPRAIVVPSESHPERIAALRQQAEAERSRAHFFWSYQQVLDRYGMPDSIYHASDGLLTWYYRTDDVEHQLGFGFYEGFVIQVTGG